MSRRVIISLFVVVAVLVTAVTLNAHCGKCPGDAKAAKMACAADANQVKAACECVWCTAGKADAKGMCMAGEQMKGCPMGEKMMNMPMCKMVRGKMAMNAQLQPADPALLLAVGEELGLSEEQTTKLNAILENARKEAKAVLTEEQVTKVKALGEASSMGKMCGKMMGCGKKMDCGKMSSCDKKMSGCKTKDSSCKKTCPLTAEKPAETQ